MLGRLYDVDVHVNNFPNWGPGKFQLSLDTWTMALTASSLSGFSGDTRSLLQGL
jgi:hypothetical protein